MGHTREALEVTGTAHGFATTHTPDTEGVSGDRRRTDHNPWGRSMDDVRLEILDYVVNTEAEGEGEAQRGVERELHTAENPKDVSSLLAESTSPGGPLALPQIWTETGNLLCVCYIKASFSCRLLQSTLVETTCKVSVLRDAQGVYD